MGQDPKCPRIETVDGTLLADITGEGFLVYAVGHRIAIGSATPGAFLLRQAAMSTGSDGDFNCELKECNVYTLLEFTAEKRLAVEVLPFTCVKVQLLDPVGDTYCPGPIIWTAFLLPRTASGDFNFARDLPRVWDVGRDSVYPIAATSLVWFAEIRHERMRKLVKIDPDAIPKKSVPTYGEATFYPPKRGGYRRSRRT